MKKKVKRIPKYNAGGITADYLAKNNMPKLDVNFNSNTGTTGANFKMDNSDGYDWNGAMDAMVAASQMGAQALGIEQGKNAAIFNTIGTAAEMIPGIGKYVSAGLKTIGALSGEGGHVDQNTGEYTKSSGLTRLFGWGRSDDSVMREANRVKGSILAKARTEDLKADWMNQGINPAPNVLAAEGGIMRQPVDALVSKGELIYDPIQKKLTKIPGNKGKANTDDDVFTKLLEGWIVVPNSDNSKKLTTNNKTVAYNLEPMVDKPNIKMSKGTIEARDRIIKKVSRLTEAIKDEPQQYAMYSGGTDNVKPYGYNKNLEAFEYWDKDKKEYKKEYLDWVNKLTEQDVKDIFNGVYGDMSTYKGVNPNYIPTVEEARKLMTDKKYGNWHKIGQAVVDKKTKAEKETPLAETPIKMNITGVDSAMWQNKYAGKYPIDYTVTPPDMNLKRLPNPSQADGIIAANRTLRKAARNAKLNSIGEAISDFAPLATALFGDYDWHTEQPQISPAKYVPTGVSIEPIRRAANESYAMARYNQENISPNTGVGMAYGLQAAANRAKTLADAYTWQQDAQNKLIAQNAGIYNDWTKRFDAARYQAIADTRANEGAAQQMKDSAIRDALEFTQGRRNDKILADMMKPMFEYGTPNEAYERIYKRRIV